MGFFSWLTADCGTSIRNIHTKTGARTVYLIQPHGQPAVREDDYEGYGVFGGIDTMEWMARHNLPAETLAGLNDDEIRSVGVTLDCGSYYVHRDTGLKYSIFHTGPTIIDPEIQHIGVTYDAPIKIFGGKTGNEMVAEGLLLRKAFNPDFRLKFSFDPDAEYSKLSASESCPGQGFFDDEDEDEEEMA